jgi:hypothetical protein
MRRGNMTREDIRKQLGVVHTGEGTEDDKEK